MLRLYSHINGKFQRQFLLSQSLYPPKSTERLVVPTAKLKDVPSQVFSYDTLFSWTFIILKRDHQEINYPLLMCYKALKQKNMCYLKMHLIGKEEN